MKVAVVAALALVALAVSIPAPTQAITDLDILNFALNLEYLEGEYYSWAAFGHGLPASYRGGGPAPTGGKKAKLSVPVQAYAYEIANDEIHHVKFLRSALGKHAVKMPAINIGTAFAAAANAAAGATLKPAFSPYAGDIPFLLGAFIFEDVGVTAYHGAAPLIVNKAYLSAAVGIAAVEAYHASEVRTLLTAKQNVVIEPYGVKVGAFVGLISKLRAKLGGGADQGIVTGNPYKANIVPTDSNSIAFSRTPGQVLNIVYGSPKGKPGLFFPKGLNGNLK